jgi:predicted secreted protein
MSLNSPVQYALLALASRTVNPTSPVFRNTDGARQLMVTTNVTVPGTGSITVTAGFISSSGAKVPLLSSTALTTAVVNNLSVGLDLTASANAIAKNAVPSRIYVDVVHNNANAITYSVDAELLP